MFGDVLKPLKKGDRLRDAVHPDRLNAMADLAKAAVSGQFINGGPGVLTTRSENGVSLRTRRARRPGRSLAPWTVNGLTVVPGTVSFGSSIMPLMNGTRLDASPAPTLEDIGHTGVGTEYYHVKCTWTPTYTNGYLSAMTLGSTAVTIVRNTSLPTSSGNDHYIHLATFVDGSLTANNLITVSPVPVTLWDNGYEQVIMRVGAL